MPLDTSIPLQIAQPMQTQALNPMTLYSAMQERQMNALRSRALEQEMAKNALAMQYTLEDRQAAAAAKAQERARAAEFAKLIRSGYVPGKEAVMGPGTVQGSTPASYNSDRVLNALFAKGDPAMLTSFSNLQEQMAKQREAEAKATGQGLTNVKTQTETKGLDIKNIDSQLAQLNAGLERAASLDEVDALFDGSAAAIRATGKTPEMSKATFRQLAARVGFDAAKMQVAQGVMKQQEHLNTMMTGQAGRSDTITDAAGNTLLLDKGTGVAIPVTMTAPAGAPAGTAGTPVRAAPTTEAQIKAAANREALPGAIEAAELTLNQLEEMVGSKNLGTKGNMPAHPGFEAAVGAAFPPFQAYVPGTSAADFSARFDQIQGGAFLKAYETLKGTGQITEKEGEKATAAVSRMGLAQSEQEFARAAREFSEVVRSAVTRAKAKLGGTSASSATAPAASSSGDADIDALLKKYSQ